MNHPINWFIHSKRFIHVLYIKNSWSGRERLKQPKLPIALYAYYLNIKLISSIIAVARKYSCLKRILHLTEQNCAFISCCPWNFFKVHKSSNIVSEREKVVSLTIHIQMDFHKRTADKIFSLVQLEEGQGVTRIIWQFF